MTGFASRPRMPLWSAGRTAWFWWTGELRGLLPARIRGERRRRIDATIHLDRDRWVLRDRRGVESLIEPHDGPAVMQALEALKGRRKQAKVAVVVPLSRCFVRRTELPRAMLSHAGGILRSELEIATPFHGGTVHWDWFTHGPGGSPGTIGITQVILKRRDTDPLTGRLKAAGAELTRVSVEDDSLATARLLPVNLARHDVGPAPDAVTLRPGRRVLVAAAVLSALAVVPAAFSQQSSALASLDQALADAKDAVALHPGLPRAPLEALGNALQIKRSMPPIDLVLDRLAAILPADCTLEHLFLDSEVLTIQGTTASVHTLERALASSPLFAAGHNTAAQPQGSERVPFTIRLKLKPASAAPES